MIRVRIDTEGQAGALTRSVMEQVADDYRSRLDGVTCPEHGEGPTVVLSGKSPDTLTVRVETCCDELRRLVDDALAEKEAAR